MAHHQGDDYIDIFWRHQSFYLLHLEISGLYIYSFSTYIYFLFMFEDVYLHIYIYTNGREKICFAYIYIYIFMNRRFAGSLVLELFGWPITTETYTFTY